MNNEFDRNSILQGNRLRRENAEKPVTFAYYNGEVEPIPSKSLQASSALRGTRQRFAGPGGGFAMKLMNDPEQAQATKDWMEMFGESNQGYEFNQAKMMEADQPADQESRGEQ